MCRISQQLLIRNVSNHLKMILPLIPINLYWFASEFINQNSFFNLHCVLNFLKPVMLLQRSCSSYGELPVKQIVKACLSYLCVNIFGTLLLWITFVRVMRHTKPASNHLTYKEKLEPNQQFYAMSCEKIAFRELFLAIYFTC